MASVGGEQSSGGTKERIICCGLTREKLKGKIEEICQNSEDLKYLLLPENNHKIEAVICWVSSCCKPTSLDELNLILTNYLNRAYNIKLMQSNNPFQQLRKLITGGGFDRL